MRRLRSSIRGLGGVHRLGTVGGEQDVARAHLLLLGELGDVRVVVGAQLRFLELDGRAQEPRLDDEVVDRAALGDAEVGAVRLEVGVEVGGRGRGGAGEAPGVDLQVADGRALDLVAIRALDLLIGDVERLRQHVAQLLHQELAAQLALEVAHGEAVGAQGLLVLAPRR